MIVKITTRFYESKILELQPYSTVVGNIVKSKLKVFPNPMRSIFSVLTSVEGEGAAEDRKFDFHQRVYCLLHLRVP